MTNKFRLLVIVILSSVAIVVLFTLLFSIRSKYVVLDKLYRFQLYLQRSGYSVPEFFEMAPVEMAIRDNRMKDVKILNPPTSDYMKYCLEEPYPFFTAGWYNNEEVIYYYLDMGIPINSRQPISDQTILHCISDPELALKLIEKGADINAVDKHGTTPLARIIYSNQTTLDTVKEYIRRGADFNYHKPDTTDTILSVVVGTKRIDILKYFLEKPELEWALKGKYGADLITRVTEYYNPQTVDFEMVSALLEKGVEINSIDSEGVPILFSIILNPHDEFFDSAIKYNIDPHIVDSNGDNALIYCTRRFIETKTYTTLIAAPETFVNRCIAVGMSINEQNADGDTALHIAARCSSDQMIEALLKSGADVNIKNKKNETPLSIAQEELRDDIVELFYQNKTDDSNKTSNDTNDEADKK